MGWILLEPFQSKLLRLPLAAKAVQRLRTPEQTVRTLGRQCDGALGALERLIVLPKGPIRSGENLMRRNVVWICAEGLEKQFLGIAGSARHQERHSSFDTLVRSEL